MIGVSNKPGRFLTPQSEASGPDVSPTLSDELASYSLEDLFADPEVRRRVGRIISKGAERRRSPSRPAPRTSRSDGSTN
jgi:hypothetical protein